MSTQNSCRCVQGRCLIPHLCHRNRNIQPNGYCSMCNGTCNRPAATSFLSCQYDSVRLPWIQLQPRYRMAFYPCRCLFDIRGCRVPDNCLRFTESWTVRYCSRCRVGTPPLTPKVSYRAWQDANASFCRRIGADRTAGRLDWDCCVRMAGITTESLKAQGLGRRGISNSSRRTLRVKLGQPIQRQT